ncbi:hypothetical protein PC9H_011392 [Pleurotus ostreatus]|uniref:Uncharacterized protein n=1 Tax=Pleurotus ostreatus TaxID=5322 RepID=A0A8H6ZIR1_PLEOS|nr:uncharacterized protein PC9H_011392 [Pleurotus ostreatus]KAF7420874.1 hypothetical protein PC9H_011392 [Pleurotus ostreatus]
MATGPPDVRLLFGPMLLGVFLNMILYGILIVQMLSYFKMYRNDSLYMKLFVGYLLVVETANTALDMHIMYEPLILNFGLPDTIKRFPTLFVTEPLIIVLVSTPIQLFFAWRIYKVTRSYWVPAVIFLFSITALAGGVWTTAKLGIIQLFSRKPELHTPALLWFLSASVADICITVALVVSLTRRKTGFERTDSVIDKIIRSRNFIWDLALSKLYSNCLLSTLNARETLVNHPSLGSSNGNVNCNISASGPRRHTESFMPLRAPNFYELDTHVVKAREGSLVDDLEYGVTVTKVVEQLEEPAPKRSQW